jgi:lysophospholipid hydrolase
LNFDATHDQLTVIEGLFYVIEGFLDILLPEAVSPVNTAPQPKPTLSAVHTAHTETNSPAYERHVPNQANTSTKEKQRKPLFTVRPGGIAGYLCKFFYPRLCQISSLFIFAASLCSTASYVDIIAKTDTYVGFLPSHALERLLEKRPIVLLTLAKRLISLLSPLGRPIYISH